MNKEEKIEETKGSKKPSNDRSIDQIEEAEIHEDTDELNLVDRIEKPVTMGSSLYIHDDTRTSAVRKFKDLSKTKPHSHEIIYDPKKDKPAKKSEEAKISEVTKADQKEDAKAEERREEAEIHEDTDELNLVDKIERPVTMGSSLYIHDDTRTSAIRKFKDLSGTKPHSHEIIYDPKKKKKSAAKSEESGQTEQK